MTDHVAIELQDGLVLQAKVRELEAQLSRSERLCGEMIPKVERATAYIAQLEAQLREAQGMRDLHKRTSDQLEANNIGLMQKLADQERDLAEAQGRCAMLHGLADDLHHMVHRHLPNGLCMYANCRFTEALTNTASTVEAFVEKVCDEEAEVCAQIAEQGGFVSAATAIRCARRRAGEKP